MVATIINAQYAFMSEENLIGQYNSALLRWQMEDQHYEPNEVIMEQLEELLRDTSKEIKRRNLPVRANTGGTLKYPHELDGEEPLEVS